MSSYFWLNIIILGGITKIENTTTATNSTESIYGIYNNSGTVTIGEKGNGVSTEIPEISATTSGTGSAYGIYNNSGGVFNFYDGIIKGKTASLQGLLTAVEPHYGINVTTDADGLQCSTLLITPTDDATAFVNGNYYNDLQAAIDSCTAGTKYYIIMMNGASSSTGFNIASGQDIVLDLSGFNITSDASYAITNNGTLTIIDSAGTGSIKNATNSAIKNNGTLTIGSDDGTVSKTAPYIEGNIYGIENGNMNVLNFYDGKIVGVTDAIYSGVTYTPTDYSTVTNTVNGKKEITLD